MDVLQAHQITIDELQSEKFNIFIFGSINDNRCTTLLRNFKINTDKTILFELPNSELKSRYPLQSQLGYKPEILKLQADDSDSIYAFFDNICHQSNCMDVKILIDYTCMSKTWYAAIINYFIRNEPIASTVSTYFSYTPLTYIKPKVIKNKELAGPLFNNIPLRKKNKPIALIMGLGYDGVQAELIYQSVKPDIVYLFYSNPAFEPGYTASIEKINKHLLSIVNKNNILCYPARDMENTDHLLTSLCLDLRLNYTLMLAPLGPKVFTLSSLLLNARYPDIEIWGINPKDIDYIAEGEPINEPVIFKAVFCQDEEY